MRTIIQVVLGAAIVLVNGLILGRYGDNDYILGLISTRSATALGSVALVGIVLAEMTKRWQMAQMKSYKHREVELERLQKEFIRNVTHELRTPLAVARGYVELLAGERLDEKERRRAVVIATDKLKELTELVGTVTTLHELTPHGLNEGPVDLEIVARAAIEMMRKKAGQAGVTLRLDSPPELPPVTGDSLRLMESLEQLLDNAIKFSPDGGQVIVRLYSKRTKVRIEITDRGIGIPVEETNRIFDRFYQIDGSTTRRFNGMGLGLTVVQAIVEAHGGQVWAESAGPGQGSTFTLCLPQATQRSVFTGQILAPALAWLGIAV